MKRRRTIVLFFLKYKIARVIKLATRPIPQKRKSTFHSLKALQKTPKFKMMVN